MALMSDKFLSIVIPAYNSEKYIEKKILCFYQDKHQIILK